MLPTCSFSNRNLQNLVLQIFLYALSFINVNNVRHVGILFTGLGHICEQTTKVINIREAMEWSFYSFNKYVCS